MYAISTLQRSLSYNCNGLSLVKVRVLVVQVVKVQLTVTQIEEVAEATAGEVAEELELLSSPRTPREKSQKN
jgi:hypothetical protein